MAGQSDGFSRTYEGPAYYDFSNKENDENSSCEADADEQESIALSDDFDEGTIRAGAVANESAVEAWDYFPNDADNGKSPAESDHSEVLDEHIRESDSGSHKMVLEHYEHRY